MFVYHNQASTVAAPFTSQLHITTEEDMNSKRLTRRECDYPVNLLGICPPLVDEILEEEAMQSQKVLTFLDSARSAFADLLKETHRNIIES